MSCRVVGLMSGTSVDGIDAVLVDLTGHETDLSVQLIASQTYAYPADLRQQILSVCAGELLSMEAFSALDDAIATSFAKAAIAIQSGHEPATLIGSHGQTVYHRPPQLPQLGYSLQLGRGDAIAYHTGITTVCNFRHADIAVRGQGAPLVSRIDLCLLSHPTQHRCVQNLGGIGNLTFLPALSTVEALGDGVMGWDTGPGNVLMDLAIQQFSEGKQTFDQDGAWAASGTPCQSLVDQWLTQDFFQQPPPKSTGRELFGPDYLQACLGDAQAQDLSPADILATLTELTAASVAHSYQKFLPKMPDEVLLCGGGSRNPYLNERLQNRLDRPVLKTNEAGLDADAKEAIAFAILAYWRQHDIPGNLPTVTGARQALPPR